MNKYRLAVKKHFFFRSAANVERTFLLILSVLMSLAVCSNAYAQNASRPVNLSDGIDSIILDDAETGEPKPDGSVTNEPQELSEPEDTPVELSLTPVEVSSELNQNLATQFLRISELEKTEDAFSSTLGEEYFSYGLMLKRSGRIEEAREMIVDALHITKVNDGVYAIEQRPMLRELFDINLSLGKTEELEESLGKIIWLENKSPKSREYYSFNMVVKLGHHFLDLYSIRPIRDNTSLELLDKSARYFSYAIRQYGDATIDQLLMPYGELSLVHYHRSKLIARLTKERFSGLTQRRSAFQRVEQSQSQEFFDETFSKTELYAKIHLSKAKRENNQPQIVAALLALGDSNLLFRRNLAAADFYRVAWEEAQKLPADDPLLLSFDKPVRLPAFNFALEKEPAKRAGANYAFLPVMVDVDVRGKVISVEDNVVGAPSNKIASRARRIVKNSRFRPAIKNGELQSVVAHQEKIRVLVSKK